MNTSIVRISFLTLAGKEVTRILRIWPQTLLPPIIMGSLYFLIFGAYIGSQVQPIGGVPYIAYIVPGLVMMGVIMNSYTNVVFSFFSAKFQRSVEELLASPTPNWVILSGYAAGGIIRGCIVGAITYGVSMFFAHPMVHSIGIIILFTLLTSVVFSLGGFLNAIFAKKFDDAGIVPTFILTPLTYLGGVFYSISHLPPLWHAISRFNPIVYMIDGFRYGFFGVSDTNIWASAALLTVCVIVLTAVNLHLLKRGTGLRS